MNNKFWNNLGFHAGIRFGPALIRTIFTLSRNIEVNKQVLEQVRMGQQSILYGMWHGQIMGASYFLRGQNAYAIAGYHRDAELIAQIIKKMGFQLIRGSSRDRGKDALTHALKVAGEPGNQIIITADGPIGPYRETKPGLAVIAKRSDALIIPIGINGTRKKVLYNSWDNFYIHLPLGKNVIVYGDPIYPEETSGPDAISDMISLVNDRLRDVQETADNYFGSE